MGQLRPEILRIQDTDDRAVVVAYCRQYPTLSQVLDLCAWEEKVAFDNFFDGPEPNLPSSQERDQAELELLTVTLPYGPPVPWDPPAQLSEPIDCGIWVANELKVSLDDFSTWPFHYPHQAQVARVLKLVASSSSPFPMF